jgi:hypothetical protein
MFKTITRRALVQRGLIASVLAPVAGLFIDRVAYSEVRALDPNESTAKALGYVIRSEKSDATCGNCSLFHARVHEAIGPCTIFPGKSVASAGWCTSWAKKA